MNGLKRLKDLTNEEYLEELKKALGNKYNKNQEEVYLELKDEQADKPAGVAIRQIAEQFRYLWEATATFINAKEAPTGRRGGEGIIAYFVSDDGTPIMGYLYGTNQCPFEQFHRYSLSGREIPNRGSHRIVNYNDEGEVDPDKVVELLKKAAENIDEMFLPDDLRGGVPKVVIGKFVPFVNAEPEWPSVEERTAGEQVRPKGELPMIQYLGGKLQTVFNGTMVGLGTGRIRYHVRPTRVGRHPLEWFFGEKDLQKLQEEHEKGSDISMIIAQLIGNQGAVCIGSLYRVERVTQPDGTETVYRDIDLVYAIPDEEASKIEIPRAERKTSGIGAGAGATTSTAAMEKEILGLIHSFVKTTDEDISLIAGDENVKKAALQKLIDEGKIKVSEEDGKTIYTEA